MQCSNGTSRSNGSHAPRPAPAPAPLLDPDHSHALNSTPDPLDSDGLVAHHNQVEQQLIRKQFSNIS